MNQRLRLLGVHRRLLFYAIEGGHYSKDLLNSVLRPFCCPFRHEESALLLERFSDLDERPNYKGTYGPATYE
jgi:hypothetical protein